MSFFTTLQGNQNYSHDQQACINTTVENLKEQICDANAKPGLLLGEIQSGKTKTFIGIIAKCFDEGYDVTIILTKNTIALAEQTLNRIEKDFNIFVEDGDISVYDVMTMPSKLPDIKLKQKLIFIAKKQKENLERVGQLFKKYKNLSGKSILIIDDEADFSSIGFKKNKEAEDGISLNVLMSYINSLRQQIKNLSFLQVTATPYCLYLQPNEQVKLNSEIVFPNKPKVTSIVPVHSQYVGGHYYFVSSEEESHPASNLFCEVVEQELNSLSKKTNTIKKRLITYQDLNVFTQSLVNYCIAGAIRCIQEEKKIRRYRTSCLIHIDRKINEMDWQCKLVETILTDLTKTLLGQNNYFETNLKTAYQSYENSVHKTSFCLPSYSEVMERLSRLVAEGDYQVVVVNSMNKIQYLLDKRTGQLKLETRLNIFIGGDVLDRGITIENLISFFYGRNPDVLQQDTVLQHSRMYGARNEMDMAVTRFYTSARIYFAMKKMYEFDNELRDALNKGEEKDGVVFISNDSSGNVRPTNPNKILITTTVTVKPNKRFIPIGFDVRDALTTRDSFQESVKILQKYNVTEGQNTYINLSMSDFAELLTIFNRVFNYPYKSHFKWNPLEYSTQPFLIVELDAVYI